jgi:uncharacterized protein YndB with AHSA1/START domain
MNTTQISQFIKAPRAKVYETLLDAASLPLWKVPDGMTCSVHLYEPREGGWIRVTLTHTSGLGAGKTTPTTDTYHGYFVTLVPNEKIVEIDEFETENPNLKGKMTLTIELEDSDGGTELRAVHSDLPKGVSAEDNTLGWKMALTKLKALLEGEQHPKV